MTGKRAKLVDQTPFWASGAAKTPGSTAQPACGLRGPRRVLQSRLFRRSSGECWLKALIVRKLGKGNRAKRGGRAALCTVSELSAGEDREAIDPPNGTAALNKFAILFGDRFAASADAAAGRP